MNPISNTSGSMARFITNMTKKDAMAPIVALESVVVAGRTWQAYKRGKGDEARERFLEETTGSITWLCGVAALNELGDKLLGKILKKSGANFDVGTDHVLRRPFDNFMKKVAPKGFSAKQVALLKGAKVLSSVVLANLFIGFVVPPINHYITKTVSNNKKDIENQIKSNSETNTGQNPSFKGAIGALNVFTNAIENTNTGKLLSTDFGIAGGRMYNARTKEERREIAFRDLGSIYFYMWAQGHIGNLLNLIESGKATRLNPSTVETVDKYLQEFLKSHNGEMSVEDFKKAVIGKKASEIKLPENIKFEVEKPSALAKLFNSEPLEVVKVCELESIITDSELMSRIRKMSDLQPRRLYNSVITKQQLLDAINNVKITDPQLLSKAYNEFTGGAASNDFKFVSNSKLENLKKEMIEYAETICKEAKDGKVNNDLLKKVKNKNMMYNGINFAAGFTVAALFLSTFIPKIQYYITRKTTGVNAFPGTYDYEQSKNLVA